MDRTVTAFDIFEFINSVSDCTGSEHDLDFGIKAPVGYDELAPGCLSFLKKVYAGAANTNIPDALVICDKETSAIVDGPHVIVPNPRLAFAQTVGEFFRLSSDIDDVHPSAHVHGDAVIGKDVKIGANAVIASSAEIGDRTVIHHNVVIGPNVVIGEDCIIRSNNVIGEEGFGVEELPGDKTFRIPHIGGVRIGNHVNMGNLNSISAGTLKPTVIGNYVQIDNLVNVAHNCEIGDATMLMPCVEIAGSTIVGKRVYVGCNASLTNGIAIGNDCQVGIGAVVIRSVENNKVIAGNPARILRNRR
ncbi:MAG: DapH/DapD/GlmU-related protein [Sphingorhabdus sp.]